MRGIARCVLAVALCLAAGSCTSGDKKPGPVSWGPCPQGYNALVRCATIDVPLDWAKPDGKKIHMGVARLAATDPAHRVGNLVFDPGGPGAAGTQYLSLQAEKGRIFTPEVLRRFDIIGIDPRGVGTSTPVRCDPAIWNRPMDLFPATAAEYDALATWSQDFGTSCRQRTGELLDHVDTVSVARDVDVLRQRLGDAKLTFLGQSYGTAIGFEYARLFPKSSRALALDGALMHSLDASVMNVTEASAYERALVRFAEWCQTDESCVLKGQDVLRLFDDLVTQAAASPLPAPGCAAAGCRGAVTDSELLTNAEYKLLAKNAVAGLSPGWPGFARVLDQARKGDATGLSSRLVATEEDDQFAGLAVGCLDYRANFSGYPALKDQITLGRSATPHVRGGSQTYTYITECLRWPTPFTNPPRLDVARPSTPTLIVNSTYDPSTAYAWAQLMTARTEGSVLLSRDGDGHTSYGSPGSTSDAIDRYLISGEVPAPGTVLPD
ncbi:peptidase [Longispora fulva]|uniref:Pimeloyl-ACP methyl ester carboxylesterase n=1 Tax=Longispora fulva TaxID=619741 RepID=A0A8J7KPM4_9ACTN|nr:alpha/beta hydrolase [Longispora fulva]MBG6136467.1 pimeloyl-ACP methyl ester carboxylesterase [Longispora fulva]GIG59635.1 peptidase [Longispora fulva]